MKKALGCLAIVLALNFTGVTQTTRYIVKFRDKGTNPYSLSNPSAFLSQRAIDRRSRHNISYDSSDLPVTPRYIDSVRLAGNVTVLNTSKWLNSVSIQTTDAVALTRINSLPFVQSVTGIAARVNANQVSGKFNAETERPLTDQRELGITANFFDYGSSFSQIHIHNGEFLHNIGLRGQNMVIGMLDAGFQNYLTVKAFDSIRANGQILGVYDFVAKDSSVNEDHSHGMQCFSTIGANIPSQFVGTAPKANFYLFRSEDAVTEFPIEEHNWVCAAERVDSVGGDVLSSSLGYNTFDPPMTSANHSFSEMDGNTTMAAIGADFAAKKGILVVNSAGNEGNNSWKRILTPADGDSVLAVGAVNTAGWAANFTSLGPSADGQVKPNVAAHGVNTTVQFPNNTIGVNNGTSFAAPNMAGLSTCLWQGFPEASNVDIMAALMLSGNRVANPNDSIGYGIPDMKKAVMLLLKFFVTSNATVSNCRTTINWTTRDMSAMKFEIERMLAGQTSFTKVGELQGTGNSFTTHSYVYEDQLTNVLSGTHSYRIRQILDTSTGAFYADYIDTVSVNLTTHCTSTGVDPVNPDNNTIVVMPNPARSDANLKITTISPVQKLYIRVFNSKGQQVYIEKTSKGSGTSNFSIPLKTFSAGKYYISVYDDANLMGTSELIKL